MTSSRAAPTNRSRVTPVGLLLAALASIVVGVLSTAAYPHLVRHDTWSPVLTAFGALSAAALMLSLLLVVASIVLRLAR